MDFMGHGTLRNVISGGQGVLSTIAAAVHDRCKDDSKKLHVHRFPARKKKFKLVGLLVKSTYPLEVELCNVPRPFGIYQ